MAAEIVSEEAAEKKASSNHIDEEAIAKALASVDERISAAHQKRLLGNPRLLEKPRMVAVSKTKPVEMILWAYNHGQRHFGENYVQELVEKSQDPVLAQLDICWHFIGHLQRNKCNSLTACPNLWAVETVDTERLASALNASWMKKGTDRKLRVFVQVNTSEETSKHGSSGDKVIALVKYILTECEGLIFWGLMTIGKIGHDYSTGPNLDFDCLVEMRKRLCEELGLAVGNVELSMGMSSDFEQAIEAGSTTVRIGSVIFGAR